MRRAGFAAIALIAGSAGLPHANAASETRTLSLHHVHTSEDLTITYKKNGQYDEDALKKINWILRDWRKNEATKMDPQEIDLLWEVYQEVGAKEPIQIVCGYRSPATNAMFRSRSRGVARFSQHTLGKAIDFYIPGVPLDLLRATAMKLQGGGVGYYPTSGSPFVHLDVGNVRAWPRMSRQQLVKLFPDGRTVHVPSDGSPLPGYQLALADLERGHRTAAPPKKRSLLAALFNTAQDAEESADNASARQAIPPPAPARRSVVAAVMPVPEAKPVQVATPAVEAKPAPAPIVVASAAPDMTPVLVPVPLPRVRPMYQIASAESRPVPVPARRPTGSINVASLSPNDIINSRGFWDGIAEPPSEAPAASLNIARRALASGLNDSEGRDTTATVGPFARADRVPPEIALAYAAQAEAGPSAAPPPRLTSLPATVVRRGSASVAVKPAETIARSQVVRVGDPLNDPWLRGLTIGGERPGFDDGDALRRSGLCRTCRVHAEAHVRGDDDVFGRSSSRHDRKVIQRQRGGVPGHRDLHRPAHRLAPLIFSPHGAHSHQMLETRPWWDGSQAFTRTAVIARPSRAR